MSVPGYSKVPIRGLVSVLGCTMVVFCFGIENTFSNMSPYMTSYIRNRSQLSPDVEYKDTLWVATGKVVSASFFMPILCMLEQILPSRICILIGAWTLSGAVVVTYFSIGHSFITTIFTDGVICSMGKALAYPITLRMAFRLFPKRKGIISGIIAACYGGSAFALNQIITNFINPHNLSPNQDLKNDRYFTQSSLLDRVPYCYLLVGCILAVVSTTGVLIMKDPGNKQKSTDDKKCCTSTTETQEKEGQEDPSAGLGEADSKKLGLHDLTPKQTLQTWRFYISWSMYFFVGFGLDIFGVLFKPYGETFISDDYFLSLVASFAAVASAVGNLTWGFLADKFTYKPVLMILICCFGTFLATLTTTEFGGKPMYFVWVCVMYFSFSGVFVLLPLLALDMFGNKHLSVNYGLIHCAGIAFSLLSALLTSQLKDIVGWHGVFLIAAGMTAVSFLLSTVLYMKKWDRLTV